MFKLKNKNIEKLYEKDFMNLFIHKLILTCREVYFITSP